MTMMFVFQSHNDIVLDKKIIIFGVAEDYQSRKTKGAIENKC